MTAKEMFTKLGWQKYDQTNIYITYKKGFRTITFIDFGENDRNVVSSGHINMETLKAINKQVEELGWLDE